MKIKIWGARGSTPAPIRPEAITEKIVSVFLSMASSSAKQKQELLETLLEELPADATTEEVQASLDHRRQVIELYLNRLSPLAASTAGGNTPCIEVRSGNDIFIIDAGSGIRELGLELMRGPCGEGKGVIHLLFSHPHWDHIQGFPFFRPAFIPGNKIFMYGVHDMEAALYRQQEAISFPISLDYMQATKTFIQIKPNEILDFGDLRIRNICNYHPGDAYSYRFEKGNKAFVYASDASYPDGMDMRSFLNFFADADLLIFDAQFTQRESDEKEDWGHSSSFVGVEMAQQANVKNLALFHYDPTYSDQDLEKILEDTLRFQQNQYPTAPPVNVFIAQEGQTFDLTPPQTAQVQQVPGSKAAILKPAGIFDEHVTGQLREQLSQLVASELPAQLIIDMSEVEMLQVAGLRGLVKLRKEYQGTPMALAGPSINVQQLIELAGYIDYFAIYPSVHVALNALQARETLNLPGQVFKNRYKIEAKIGEGRLGTVFKAADIQQNSPVAIKILSPSFSETAIDQFLQQARQIVNLHHPNIVNVYDCDEDRGIAFMAEEIVENRTLRDIIGEAHGQPLPLKVALSISQGIIRALEYAHTHGIIHGDLKPKNVLLAGGDVKVSDFGLGRLEGGKILFNLNVPLALGSARYLAPEQVLGHPIDARTDLYAFGVILYELFTGVPIVEGSDQEMVESYRIQAHKPPRQINPGLSRSLEHLILKLLDRDPTRRYATARQVRLVLNSMAVSVSRDPDPGAFATQRSPLLAGRDSALKKLMALWAETEQGRGQVVLIQGEVGLGKTRLIQELTCRLNQATVLMGDSQPLPGYPAYQPFVSALQAYSHTHSAIATELWQEISRLAPELGQINTGFKQPPVTDAAGDPEAIVRLVAAQPWLIILDDLQWADPGSLKLFEYLAQRTQRLPMMLVATVDPAPPNDQSDCVELLARLAAQPNTSAITLKPLTEAELKKLLESIWLQSIPADLGTAIFNRTRGNPLFAETIAHGLVDDAVVNWRDEKWHFGPVVEVGLPATLKEAVLRRINHLSRETQTMLNQAAVLGPTFNFDDLHEVSDLSAWDALESVNTALERQLLKGSPGEHTLRFSHPIIQHVLYHGLSTLKQRLLHREAGEALERRHLPNIEPLVEALAHHFLRAGEPDKTLTYILPAAQKASRLYANKTALYWYSVAFEQLDLNELPPDQQFDLLLAREALLNVTGPAAAQSETLAQLEALAQALNQPNRQALVHVRRANFEFNRSRVSGAATEAQAALIAARQAADPPLESESLIQLANIALHRGEFNTAREQLYAAQNSLSLADAPLTAAKRLNSLGLLYKLLNDYTESEQYFRQAATLSRQADDRHTQATCLSTLGEVLLEKGELMEAWKCQRHALQIAQLCGNQRLEARVLDRLAAVHIALGRLATAETLTQQARTMHKLFDDEQGLALNLRLMGRLQLLRLDYVTARDYVGQALEIFQHSKNRGQEGETWLILALALEGLHHPNQARHAFEQVHILAESLGNHTATLDATAGLARLLLVAGKKDEAVGRITAGLSQISAGNAVWRVKYPIQFYLTALEILKATGHTTEAAQALQLGRALLEQQLAQIETPEQQGKFINNLPVNKAFQEYLHPRQPEKTSG